MTTSPTQSAAKYPPPEALVGLPPPPPMPVDRSERERRTNSRKTCGNRCISGPDKGSYAISIIGVVIFSLYFAGRMPYPLFHCLPAWAASTVLAVWVLIVVLSPFFSLPVSRSLLTFARTDLVSLIKCGTIDPGILPRSPVVSTSSERIFFSLSLHTPTKTISQCRAT